MEEARQYTPLTESQIGFAVLHFGGLIAIAVAFTLEFIIGGSSATVGAMLFLLSRAAICVWQAIRPNPAHIRKSSRIIAALAGAIFLGFAFGLSMPFWVFS